MLLWLNRDSNEAGKQYEEIRSALIKRFRQLHSRSEPEELANTTFDRVAKTLPKTIETYVGPPEPYFFSVAWFVYKEDLRKPVPMPLPAIDFPPPSLPNPEEAIKKELLYSCLEECMEELSPTNQVLISDYYQGERQEKIRRRKELAERLGITLALLRLKAQRIRLSLKKCILECMRHKGLKGEAIM
jgi:DNA-directed RNA polymerase specialized sigma24 family protein